MIPDAGRVFSVDGQMEIDQVVKKLRKKVTDGRQFAKAAGKPAVLFLARTPLGADRESAEIALGECFASADFAALSGVVLSDSYWLQVTSWKSGQAPDVPLTDEEGSHFSAWYG